MNACLPPAIHQWMLQLSPAVHRPWHPGIRDSRARCNNSMLQPTGQAAADYDAPSRENSAISGRNSSSPRCRGDLKWRTAVHKARRTVPRRAAMPATPSISCGICSDSTKGERKAGNASRNSKRIQLGHPALVKVGNLHHTSRLHRSHHSVV